MKSRVSRWTAWLLVLVLLIPTGMVSAEEDHQLFYVTAKDIFTERSEDIELLDVEDRCYISIDAFASLIGFSISEERDFILLKGATFSYRASTQKISTIQQDGKKYYPLEALADKCELFLLDNGDGVLYFSSTLRHLDDLYSKINEIIDSDRFDADLLRDLGALRKALDLVGEVYDTITKGRIDKAWGKAQVDDYKEVVCDLLKRPEYNDKNLLETLKKVNKGYGAAVGILTKGIELLYDNRSTIADQAMYFDELFSTNNSWKIISGIYDLNDLNKVLKKTENIRKADLANLFFHKDIETIAQVDNKNLSLDLSSEIEVFGLSDILSTGAYYISVLQIDTGSASTLKELLTNPTLIREDDSLHDINHRDYFVQAGQKVVEDYYNTLKLDGSFWRSLGKNITETMINNSATSLVETLTFTKVEQLIMKVSTFFLNLFFKSNRKVEMVRKITMLKECQDYFKDYLHDTMEWHRIEDAELCIGAIELYLKCVRCSFEAVSTEKMKSDGVPTGAAIDAIDEQLFSLMEFYPAMFRFVENTIPILASSLRNGETDTVPINETADEDVQRIKEETEVFLNEFVSHAYFDENYLFNAKGDAYAEERGLGSSSHEAFWFVLQPLYKVLYEEDSSRFLQDSMPLLNTNRSCMFSDDELERIANDPYVSQWIDYFDQYYVSDVEAVLDRLYGNGRVTAEEYFGREGFVTDDGFFLKPTYGSGYFPVNYYNYHVHEVEITNDGLIKATVSCVLIKPDMEWNEWQEIVYGTYSVYDIVTEELLDQGFDESIVNDDDYYEFARQYQQSDNVSQFEIDLYEDETGIHILPEGHTVDEDISIDAIDAASATVGDTIIFGSYEQDNDLSNGPEPIEWIVLDSGGGRVLVISKYVLDSKRIWDGDSEEDYWERKGNWEACFMRTWLNDTFFNTAFSAEEQKCISSHRVTADWNPDWDSGQGNDTKDKVYLLSVREAELYFDSDESRICIPTAYAIEQGGDNIKYKNMVEGEPCAWWLRTAGSDYYFSDCIITGLIDTCGTRWGRDDIGVRPVLWLKVK